MELIKEEITYKGARLKIITDKEEYVNITVDELVKQRELVEDYIIKDKEFFKSLKPLKVNKNAPKIVKLMAEGAYIANVGPMAAVAGTIAELMVEKMVEKGAKVALVENGGDIFAYTEMPLNVGIYAGYTKLSDKLAFVLNKENTPLAICSSSKMGHSKTFGDCDLATIFSKKGYIADAVATAVGNKVKTEKDIKPTLNWAIKLKDVLGVIVIKEDHIGIIGNIPPLIKNKDVLLKDKVTKEDFYIL